MPRPRKTVPMERLCVTIPADEVKAAKQAAAAAGVTWADFVRQAFMSQAAVEREARKAASKRGGLERAARAAVLSPVDSRAMHEHVAGPMLSGGIHRCMAKDCEARKVGGRWVET